MNCYAEGACFSNEEMWAYDVAKISFRYIPDGPHDTPLLRCHEVAHIIANLFSDEIAVVDGKYGMSEHSWLVSRGWDPQHLLDVYAVDMVPPVQLVDTFPTPRLYIPGHPIPYDKERVEKASGIMRGSVWEGQIIEALAQRGGLPAIEWWRQQPGQR